MRAISALLDAHYAKNGTYRRGTFVPASTYSTYGTGTYGRYRQLGSLSLVEAGQPDLKSSPLLGQLPTRGGHSEDQVKVVWLAHMARGVT